MDTTTIQPADLSDDPIRKVCRCCKEAKKLEAFSPMRSARHGRHPVCMECRNRRARKVAADRHAAGKVRKYTKRSLTRVVMEDGTQRTVGLYPLSPEEKNLAGAFASFMRRAARPGDPGNVVPLYRSHTPVEPNKEFT